MMRRLHLASRLIATLAAAIGAPSLAGPMRMNADVGGPYVTSVTSWRDMPFQTVVRQQYDFSCGSAALATLLRYQYGRVIDEQSVFKSMFEIGDQAKIRKVGFSMLDMKRYATALGLRADGYKVSLDTLAKGGTPAIVVQQLGPYKHFVVVKGLQGGQVLVGDPAAGLRLYRRDQFERTWNGIALVIYPPATVHGAVFNRANDWSRIVHPNYEQGLARGQSIQALTLDLPTLFQVTPPTPPVPVGP